MTENNYVPVRLSISLNVALRANFQVADDLADYLVALVGHRHLQINHCRSGLPPLGFLHLGLQLRRSIRSR